MSFQTLGPALNRDTTPDRIRRVLTYFILPFGLFLQLSGIIWLPDGSAYVTQNYLWLLFPVLLLLLLDLRYIKSWRPGALELLTMALLLWYATSAFWSDTEYDPGQFFKRALYSYLYMVAVIYLVRSHKCDFGRLIEIAGLVVAVGAGISLIVQFGFNDMIPSITVCRLYSMGLGKFGDFGNPNSAGIFYGVFSLILFFRIIEKKNWGIYQLLCVLAVVVIQTYVLFTWSRSAQISILLGYVLTTVFFFNRKSVSLLILLIMQFMILWGVFTGNITIKENPFSVLHSLVAPTANAVPNSTASGQQDIVIERQDIQSSTEPTRTYSLDKTGGWSKGSNKRLGIWLDTIELIKQKPWFGYGVNASFALNYSWSVVTHPHSVYLLIAYQTGLIGFGLFLVILLLVAKQLWQYREGSYGKLAFVIFIFGFSVMSVEVHKFLSRPDPCWMLFFLPLGMVMAVRARDKMGPLIR